MKKVILVAVMALNLVNFMIKVTHADDTDSVAVASAKNDLLSLAKSFEGQGDPDFSKQRQLDALVEKLLQLSPQPPVKNRLNFIYGTWKQVWGPYEYRNDQRGVDPELGTDEIYQVVSKDGYYYNVSPLYKNGDRNKERIGLLRGEYTLDSKNLNVLRVKFTRYPGVSRRPTDLKLWELAPLAEADELENQITIVPTFIVRLFFRGGALREVYTDSDLRIVYGSSSRNFTKEAIYIMTKVKQE